MAELRTREVAADRTPPLRGAVAHEFSARAASGQFRQAKDARAWIKKRTGKALSVSGGSTYFGDWVGN